MDGCLQSLLLLGCRCEQLILLPCLPSVCFLFLSHSNFTCICCLSSAHGYHTEISPPSPCTHRLINKGIIKPPCIRVCVSKHMHLFAGFVLKWCWGLMNIISGQTGIKEQREDETERREERLNLSSLCIECDDATQTVVSNCCLPSVYFYTISVLLIPWLQ